jgi:type IV pilus assembly protein PilA
MLELMIVVAIAGILMSIVMPSYDKFSARARQTDARSAMSALYLTEQAFYAEFATYSQCLRQIGYVPEGVSHYYMMGFMAGPDSSCGPDGTGDCGAYRWIPTTVYCNTGCGAGFDIGLGDATYQATRKVASGAILVNTCANQSAAGVPTTWSAWGQNFLAGAFGNISRSPIYDQWTVDEKRQLINIVYGI